MRFTLIENFLSLSFFRGFQLLVPLITLPYLINILGLSNYGKIAFAQSIALFFGALIQYGFNLTATRKVSRQKNNWTKIEETFSLTLVAGLFLTSISASLLIPILVIFIEDDALFWICIFSFLTVSFQSLLPIWFFNGLEKLKFIALVGTLSNICFLIGIFTFVTKTDHTLRVPLIHSITSFFALAFTLIIAHSIMKVSPNFSSIALRKIMRTLKENRSTFIAQFAPNLYNNASIFLLGVLGGPIDVGLFSAAKRVVDAFCSIAQIICNTFIAELSNDIKYFTAFRNIVVTVGIVTAVIIWVLSDYLALFYGDINIERISFILKSLTPAALLYFVMLCYGQTYLIISDNEEIYQNITLIVSVFALAIASVLIYIFGAVGAVCTVTGARLAISSASYFYYLKLNGSIVDR